MKTAGLRFCLVFLLGVASAFASLQDSVKDRALKALRSGDYHTVIRLCLDALQNAPGDEEIVFLLSRAYAIGQDYDRARRTLEPLIRRSPKNTDYLLLRARIEFWNGNAAGAEAGFNEVLALSPQNAEGWAGLARIAAGKGDFSVAERFYLGSLARDPNDAEVHYALGVLYRRQGAFEKARASFKQARRLDPKNPDYKKALTRIPGRSDTAYEIRYILQPETFSDGRSSFLSGQGAYCWRLPKNGPALVFKWDQTKRFDRGDSQFGMEVYPRLWKGGSAYLDFNYSPSAALYPKLSYLVEIYQALSGTFDASLGYRYIKFEPNLVSVYIGSLGAYYGSYYSCLRVYLSPKSNESKISWLFLTRRYFTDRNYIFIGYGQGTRSMEIAAAGDLDFKDVKIIMAGFDWTLFRNLHLLASYCRLNDRGLGRNTFVIGAGYKWGE
ncbi:MAG: YaiO family outer membrane beta-barrel protein [Candidatus Aminicenantes bacterium]|nr:YaiO family outer membrane beta-barrel protein [Candidatus Aminicenantes bacterium]